MNSTSAEGALLRRVVGARTPSSSLRRLLAVTSLPLLGLTCFAMGALAACDDSSSDTPTDPNLDGGVNLDSGPDPTPENDAGDGAPAATGVTVTVTKLGLPLADARVILHDTAGSVVGDQKTDAQGKLVLAQPPDSLTVLVPRLNPGGEVAGGLAVTYTSIAAGDNLVVDATDHLALDPGTFAVSAPTPVPTGTNHFIVRAGRCVSEGDLPVTVPLSGDCVRAPMSLLVSAHNGDSLSSAWAFKKNITRAAGSQAQAETVGAWAPGTQIAVKGTSVPTTGQINVALDVISEGLLFPGEASDGSLDGTNGAQFNVPAGFADGFQTRVTSEGEAAAPLYVSTTGFLKRVPGTATSIDVDFAQALPRITSAAIDRTDVNRPEISWVTAAPTTVADGGYASMTWVGNQTGAAGLYTWTFVVPPTATKIKAPALPENAKAFVPGEVIPIVNGVAFADAEGLPSYAAFRAVPVNAAAGRPSHVGGAIALSFPLPQDGFLRASVYDYTGD